MYAVVARLVTLALPFASAMRPFSSGDALRSINGFLMVVFLGSVSGGVGVALVVAVRVVRVGAAAAVGVFVLAAVVRVGAFGLDAINQVYQRALAVYDQSPIHAPSRRATYSGCKLRGAS